MTEVPVDLIHITKRFGKGKAVITAVDNISHQFEAGKLTTLLGPSGCGKTTTLRCIAGFYQPEEGDILINGERVNHLPPYSRPTGTVFQNYALFPHMTVFENVAYGLRIKKLSETEIKKKVAEGLGILQLEGMADRMPGQLSGGQQQRVAIARVLVNEPQVLLFDEPLSNLDAKLRVYMRGEIRNLQERLGITTIYVTHDQEEAMSISDTMLVMNKGRIEQVGTPLELYAHPGSHFVTDFIGKADFLPGKIVADGKIQILDQQFDLPKLPLNSPIGSDLIITIRPEAIHLIDDPGSSDTHFQGTIQRTTFLGSIIEYEVAVTGLNNLIVHATNPAVSGIYPTGTRVGLHFPHIALHPLPYG